MRMADRVGVSTRIACVRRSQCCGDMKSNRNIHILPGVFPEQADGQTLLRRRDEESFDDVVGCRAMKNDGPPTHSINTFQY
jgi:hypothetical protein